jgi:hypothetical protein
MKEYLKNIEEHIYLTMPAVYAPKLLNIDPIICRRSNDNQLIVWDSNFTPEQKDVLASYPEVVFYTYDAILELMQSEAWSAPLDVIEL